MNKDWPRPSSPRYSGPLCFPERPGTWWLQYTSRSSEPLRSQISKKQFQNLRVLWQQMFFHVGQLPEIKTSQIQLNAAVKTTKASFMKMKVSCQWQPIQRIDRVATTLAMFFGWRQINIRILALLQNITSWFGGWRTGLQSKKQFRKLYFLFYLSFESPKFLVRLYRTVQRIGSFLLLYDFYVYFLDNVTQQIVNS